MSEIRPELALWVAYLEKKEELEEAADRIAELEAALRGLLEWAGPIAGDTRVVSERAFEEETVRIANAALEGGKS